MKRLVKDVMTAMPHTVGNDISVAKAKHMMEEHSCHHLPVLHGGELVGVVSERDVRMATAGNPGEDIKVESMMTDEPLVVAHDVTVKEAVNAMVEAKAGSVIVRGAQGESWGIFTVTDALKFLATVLDS